MKRILTVSVLLVLSLALLAGCSKATYKDGTYVAVSDANDKGYYQVEVTIKKDKITAVEVVGLDKIGLAKGEGYPHEPYFTAVEELPKQFVAKNGTNIDGVAGATSTTNGAKQAVERVLEKALVEPKSTAKYFDGTFMATSEQTDYGWTIAWVTIENDTITAVDFHSTTAEKNEAGEATGNFVRKGEDYPHQPYHEARATLPALIVEKNGFEGVNNVTGATSTSTQLKAAVEAALQSALRK